MHKGHSSHSSAKTHRAGHHIEHPAHKKHHGHKEAHVHHEKMKHHKMQIQHANGVCVHGPDYKNSKSIKDTHQQGISRVIQRKEEQEVGQSGKMHWSSSHREEFHKSAGKHKTHY